MLRKIRKDEEEVSQVLIDCENKKILKKISGNKIIVKKIIENRIIVKTIVKNTIVNSKIVIIQGVFCDWCPPLKS